ncbi:cytochrome C biogenesis protein [Sulfurifustis variabilis]|uniref:Cytochrome C biogenesis protein n=1 Tax=Sulfurifustis variabilis TaxID=1675686 RepID=A0A1B4VBF8_9GAMM|nr:cytochrome c biogenesis protein CcdA [Sulfurifustis variabilis]BAU49664.1 cytochrome C biogenesis protein [Sulfurifustis variabilis]
MEFSFGLFTVFLAGLISFLSPCVLPLVPAYLSYVAGESIDELRIAARPRLAVLGLSACFVLGFSSVFLLFGASATALGRLFLAYRYEANLVAGALVIAFGLFMTGLLTPRLLARDYRLVHKLPHFAGARPLGAGVLGVAFGFGWTPCIGPVLGSILTLSATTEAVTQGIALLGVYALGLGVPFLLVAAFTETFVAHLGVLRRFGRPLHVAAGLVLIALGLAMITGKLSAFAFWLLDTFPVLGRIG